MGALGEQQKRKRKQKKLKKTENRKKKKGTNFLDGESFMGVSGFLLSVGVEADFGILVDGGERVSLCVLLTRLS